MSSSAQASAAAPAAEPERTRTFNRNVDYEGNAYSAFTLDSTDLMKRPRFNTAGKEALISINSHKILKYPKQTVYQYDIVVGSGSEKRGLIRNVWASQTVKEEIGEGFIFDGNRIGWSMTNFAEVINIKVDLDEGRSVKEGAPPNKHRVLIKKTGSINLVAIESYLGGKLQFDNKVLEAINFLDHLLRETPSKSLISLKRSYFGRTGGERELIGGGVEAMKGVYQSIRAAQGKNLVINADVSNTTFWHETNIAVLAKQITGSMDMIDLIIKLRPVPGGGASGGIRESYSFAALRRLCKNDVFVRFRNAKPAILKPFKIDRISPFTAKTHKFDSKDIQTGAVDKDITVERYFQKRYNVHLQYPDLPLLEVGNKGVMYPMELCHMAAGQRYPYKLDEMQTSKMIKFAVSKPYYRKEAIQRGLNMLNWEGDAIFKNYGLVIDREMLKTNARILNAPVVQFAGSQEVPRYAGRWNIKGKRFLSAPEIELRSWGVSIVGSGRYTTPAKVNTFIQKFIKSYQGHGGKVVNPTPEIMWANGLDGGKIVENLFNKTGNANKKRPELMIFILENKNADMYNRIKKSADCRYGVVSQCVQSAHVNNNNLQYHSNLCMKVNAKLGGTTSRVAPKPNRSVPFNVPTMIIGADVSHAAPGSNGASFAALTVSMDKIAARYAAAVETNGIRTEMITTKNIREMLKPLIQSWKISFKNNGPDHVYYFRDGASEGQYQAVIKQEVADMKALFAELSPGKEKAKFTVVIAEKRHHIRFFPNGQQEDRNGNPVPGTLVDRDITHPFEYDFYLCSHAAIQGTARPTHYHVLMDEFNHTGNDLQTMIYEHSYQYMRSTTPVSLFPAVYYAHLASNRARSHIITPNPGQHAIEPEPEPLIPMDNNTNIRTSMWYI